ncbi:hypothetical protein D9M68_531080 [compost metagenome]
MTADRIASISDRYIELYEQITGENFVKNQTENIAGRIQENINKAINELLSK